MPSAGSIRAGKAHVEIGIHDKMAAGLRRAQRVLAGFGRNVQRIGLQMTRVTAVAAFPAALAVKVGAEFESRMARVRALSGAVGVEFAELNKKARALGETTVFSSSQVADAMSAFSLAGYRTSQTLDAIGPTLSLAAAGQMDVSQAADIAVKTMAGMGIAANRVGYAMDVLTKAMTTANTDLVQLGEAMKYVGPVAKAAGIGFEEIVAAVQLLSNAGIQGEMAGSTLRGMLLALTSPSEEARKQLDKLGVSVTDAAGNVRPLAAVIADMQRGLAGMGSGARLDALGQIFQARQAAGAAELLTQGSEQLRRFTESLRRAGGTASKIAGTQLNTLAGSATILKSAVEGLGIAIAEALGPPLRVVIDRMAAITGIVADWVKENRGLVATLGAMLTASAAIGGTLIAVGSSFRLAAFGIGGLTGTVAALSKIVATAAGPWGALAIAMGGVVAGIAVARGHLKAFTGPLVAAADTVMRKFAEVRDLAGTVVQGITNAFASGQPALAAKIMWAGIEVAFRDAMQHLDLTWQRFRVSFIMGWHTMAFTIQAAMQEIYHGIEIGNNRLTSALSRGLEYVFAEIATMYRDVWNENAKRMLGLMARFDSRIDLEATKAMADEETKEKNAATLTTRDDRIADMERRLSNRREQARRVHEATMAQIGQAYEMSIAARQSELDGVAARAKLELHEAKRELQVLLNSAKAARAVSEGMMLRPLLLKFGVPGLGSLDTAFEAINKQIMAENAGKMVGPMGRPLVKETGIRSAIDQAIEGFRERLASGVTAAETRMSVFGTFSGEVAARLGGAGNDQQRTAKATEQLLREIKELRHDVRRGGAKFATR